MAAKGISRISNMGKCYNEKYSAIFGLYFSMGVHFNTAHLPCCRVTAVEDYSSAQ